MLIYCIIVLLCVRVFVYEDTLPGILILKCLLFFGLSVWAFKRPYISVTKYTKVPGYPYNIYELEPISKAEAVGCDTLTLCVACGALSRS